MNDKKYYWLKLKKDFFKRHDIQIIEAMPNGKDYILFYLKLLVESVDHDGGLRFNDTVPYNEAMLSTITNTNVDIVRSAMKIFTELKMIDMLEDKTIYMNEVQKMMGTETYWAEQKRKQKQNKLEGEREFQYIKKLSYERLQLPNGKVQYVDNKRYGGNAFEVFERAEGECEICGSDEKLCIHHKNGYSNELEDLIVLCRKCHRKDEIQTPSTEFGKFPLDVQLISNVSNQEIDKDKDKDKELKIDTSIIIDKWNSLILARVINIKGNRLKILNARLKEYGETEVLRALDNISLSSFLKGQNSKGWIITFDWFINPNNFIKVLEGNYTDKTKAFNAPTKEKAKSCNFEY